MGDAVVTLQQIALETGFSKAAVSLALRGRPGVSQETRKQVAAAAGRLGYRPDPAVSSLAERRWRHGTRKQELNLVFVSTEGGVLSRQNSLLSTAAAKQGYGFVTVTLTPGMKARDLNRQLRSLAVQGVILDRLSLPEFANEEWWSEVAWRDHAWVACNEARFSPPIHRVFNNTYGGTQRALEGMMALGYRRIAFLRGSDAFSQVNGRQHAAYLQFRARHRRLQAREIVLDADMHLTPKGAEAIRKFEPEALLIGFMGVRRDLPEDLRSIPYASLAVWEPEAGVAGCCWDAQELAQGAIGMLDYLIRSNQRGLPSRRHTLLVDGVWMEGASLPALSMTH